LEPSRQKEESCGRVFTRETKVLGETLPEELRSIDSREGQSWKTLAMMSSLRRSIPRREIFLQRERFKVSKSWDSFPKVREGRRVEKLVKWRREGRREALLQREQTEPSTKIRGNAPSTPIWKRKIVSRISIGSCPHAGSFSSFSSFRKKKFQNDHTMKRDEEKRKEKEDKRKEKKR